MAAILVFRSAQKHKLGFLIGQKNTVDKWRWVLASCKIWLNFLVVSKKSKLPQPIRGHGDHLGFPIGYKNTTLLEDVNTLLPVKFRWILFSCIRGAIEYVSINQRSGRNLGFPIDSKNINFAEDVEILLPVKYCWIPFSSLRVENVSANQRPGWPSFDFPIGPKNTNLEEELEILLLVKFRCIPFSGFKEEVENVSVNQRPGLPSWISDRPEKHNLGRGLRIPLYVNRMRSVTCIWSKGSRSQSPSKSHLQYESIRNYGAP